MNATITVASKLTSKEVNEIDQVIEMGMARSRGDFVRLSVIKHLNEIRGVYNEQ